MLTNKSAIVCLQGLGDGLIALSLASSLHHHGWVVDLFHNGVLSVANWFQNLSIQNYPHINQVDFILSSYDYIFVFYDTENEVVQSLIRKGKELAPHRVKVLYVYPSKGIYKEPYYSDSEFNPDISVHRNLQNFVQNKLNLTPLDRPQVTPPLGLLAQRFSKRVAIHPMSSRAGKNWGAKKYIQLAEKLELAGYEPVWILSEKERADWPTLKFLPPLMNLSEVASLLYESAYFIGNDSGIGHLASVLGIPTLTLMRRQAVGKLWRPAYTYGKVLTPHRLIPNIRGLRWRDRYWQRFLSVSKVWKGFQQLMKEIAPSF